jgi:hypothetical protein
MHTNANIHALPTAVPITIKLNCDLALADASSSMMVVRAAAMEMLL